jgi:hypothetical protein
VEKLAKNQRKVKVKVRVRISKNRRKVKAWPYYVSYVHGKLLIQDILAENTNFLENFSSLKIRGFLLLTFKVASRFLYFIFSHIFGFFGGVASPTI